METSIFEDTVKAYAEHCERYGYIFSQPNEQLSMVGRKYVHLENTNRIVRRCVAGAKVFTRSSRMYKVAPCGLVKYLPCALRLRGVFCQNLVCPNLYTEKPLKRNDRYDRKNTTSPMC